MAIPQIARVPAYEAPESSPIYTSVIEWDWTETALAAGVLILGDDTIGRWRRFVDIAERQLNAGRQCVLFTTDTPLFGLSSSFPDLVRIGRNLHGISVQATDGELIADIAVASGRSMVVNLGSLEPVGVSAFLRSFLARVVTADSASMTLYFDMLDEMMPRKRHRDASTVTSFGSILRRGRRQGVQVVATAQTQYEIPIETNKYTMTMVLSRTSKKENLESVAQALDPRLVAERHAPWSAMNMSEHHQFVWPFQDQGLHMPYYLGQAEPTSDAGPGEDVNVTDTTPAETEFVKSLQKSRSDRDASAETTAKRRGPVITCKPHFGKSASTSCKGGKKRSNGIVAAKQCRDIARTIQSVRMGLDTSKRLFVSSELLDGMTVENRNIADSGKWIKSQLNRIDRGDANSPFTEIASSGIIGAARVQAMSTNPKKAATFFDRLANGKMPMSLHLEINALNEAQEPMRSVKRLEAISKAFDAQSGDRSTRIAA